MGRIQVVRVRSSEVRGIAAMRRIAGYSAFTLTELLVVITIIAILAALITAGAIRALNRSKEVAITLEIGQLADAMERFKNEQGGAYPPNIFSGADLTVDERKINSANAFRFLTKTRPRATEFNASVAATTGNNNLETILTVGIRPSEALVLWLLGLSSDPQRPLSGSDLELTSIDDDGTRVDNVITYDSFDAPLYEFDEGRLRISRNPDGTRRSLLVYGQGGAGPAELILYEYFPKNSDRPFVYFNTVDSPEQMVRTWQTSEPFYEDAKDSSQVIYPLKRMKADAPKTGTLTVQHVEYVNPGKYQILHAGLDNAWGNFDALGSALDVNDGNYIPTLLYPTGPFTGDIADTLTNFIPGTLESAQE
jgi:prepilin-type N-terminal cleavage/methylation domain-containing protein